MGCKREGVPANSEEVIRYNNEQLAGEKEVQAHKRAWVAKKKNLYLESEKW